jgi:hypothetical protein
MIARKELFLMPKYQCEDVCANDKYKMGHVCCIFCEHKDECAENEDCCDSIELGIEHCPLRMEVGADD